MWIDGELAKLRPYSDSFRAWIVSGRTDKSRLLRGGALKEAEQWVKEKNPSAEDQDFLSASRTQEREEEIAIKEREAELERERQDKETAEKARKIEAEAKEKAEKRLEKANQRIGIGTLVLAVAFALAGVLGIAAFIEGKKAIDAQNQAKIEQQKADQAQQKATEATRKVENKNKELGTINKQLGQANKQKEIALTIQKEAQKQREIAQEKADRAKGELTKVQGDKQRLERQTKTLVANAENLTRNLRAKAEEKRKAEQQISAFKKQQQEIKNKLVNSNNLLTSTQGKLKEKNQEFGAKEKELKTVTTLSQNLATQLSQKGKTDEANEALKYAGLYFQINDPKLKQAMLLAATSLAYQNLENWQQSEASINDSLKLLPNNVNIQNPSDETVQTWVFSKSIEGDLFKHKNNKEEAMKAYNIAFQLLEKYPTQTNPFQNQVAVLTPKNVESIHRNLLNLIPEKSPQNAQIRTSLKQHLLAELDYLMQQKKWIEADKKNWQFILFVAKSRISSRLEVAKGRTSSRLEKEILENFKNFSCSDLKELDKLWVKNSSSLYGFSIQKRIYLEEVNSLSVDWDTGEIVGWTGEAIEAYNRYGDRIGWRQEGDWLSYDKGSTQSLDKHGHFPFYSEMKLGDPLWEIWFSSCRNL